MEPRRSRTSSHLRSASGPCGWCTITAASTPRCGGRSSRSRRRSAARTATRTRQQPGASLGQTSSAPESWDAVSWSFPPTMGERLHACHPRLAHQSGPLLVPQPVAHAVEGSDVRVIRQPVELCCGQYRVVGKRWSDRPNGRLLVTMGLKRSASTEALTNRSSSTVSQDSGQRRIGAGIRAPFLLWSRADASLKSCLSGRLREGCEV